MGFPFLSGFFSKDTRLESIISGRSRLLIKLVFFLRVILTIGYRIKFIILSRLKFSRFGYLIIHNNFINKVVFYSLIILLGLSVLGGYIYCFIFFDYYLIIDLEDFVKFRIVIFFYYLYFYLYIHSSKKKYDKSTALRFFSFLFFLRELTSACKIFINKSVLMLKYLDLGWLEQRCGIWGRNNFFFFFFFFLLKFLLNFFFFFFFLLFVITFTWFYG